MKPSQRHNKRGGLVEQMMPAIDEVHGGRVARGEADERDRRCKSDHCRRDEVERMEVGFEILLLLKYESIRGDIHDFVLQVIVFCCGEHFK